MSKTNSNIKTQVQTQTQAESESKPETPIVSPSDGGDKLVNYLTCLGHLCSDINQGAISAVLPFFVVGSGYGYAQVAMLIFASNIASAVIQPLFGTIGDKKACPWFMALGVFLAGLGVCGIGLLNNYWLIVTSAMVSGIGVAMFHPEGGRLANLAAGKRKGNGMSIFAVGGNLGMFIGPIIAATSLTVFGMHGTLVFLFPALACAVVLLAFNRRFLALGIASDRAAVKANATEHWGKFGIIMGVLSLRSIVTYGLLAFIPLFLVGVMGQSEAVSSLTISIFAIAGAVGTLFSGRICEKLDVYCVMIAGLALTSVLVVFFAFNRLYLVAVIIAVIAAIALCSFYPATVALGMSYVPRHLGTASGLSYGVAICVGGISEPILGMVGDSIGLPSVMGIIATCSALACAFAIVLCVVDKARGPRSQS